MDADVVAAVGSAASAVWASTARLGVLSLVILVVVCVGHYLAAATAARAAAGVRLPFGELVAAQLAASAANRLTPSGVGGAAVLARFFTRRGRVRPENAVAAVSTLAVLGSLADTTAFAGLVGIGALVGASGAAAEVPLLASRFAHVIPVASTGALWLIIGSVGASAALVAIWWAARHGVAARLRRGLHGYGRGLLEVVRSPARVTTLVTASAGTTLLLAAGFAAAATLHPGGVAPHLFCALMIGYMVSSAAGNALPTPGGIGTADAAFVGVLVAAAMPVAAATATVLVFRLITFWAPAALGLAVARPLRRRGAL